MGLVLEAQIPENVVDQMKEALVDQRNLLDYCSLGRVPVTKEAGSQKRQEVKRHLHIQSIRHLHVDLSIE